MVPFYTTGQIKFQSNEWENFRRYILVYVSIRDNLMLNYFQHQTAIETEERKFAWKKLSLHPLNLRRKGKLNHQKKFIKVSIF